MEERRFMYTSDHTRGRIQERCGINKASCANAVCEGMLEINGVQG